MYSLENLQNLTAAFHARTLSMPQFGAKTSDDRLNAQRHQQQWGEPAGTHMNGNQPDKEYYESVPSPVQPKDRPAEFVNGQPDNPANRSNMSDLAAKAKAFSSDANASKVRRAAKGGSDPLQPAPGGNAQWKSGVV